MMYLHLIISNDIMSAGAGPLRRVLDAVILFIVFLTQYYIYHYTYSPNYIANNFISGGGILPK
jgi:hypothetical protein